MTFKRILIVATAVLLAATCAITLLIVNPSIAQPTVDSIAARAVAGRSTIVDKAALTMLYAGMLTGGYAVYPEAAAILRSYLYGATDTLQLPSTYYARSAFIRRAIGTRDSGTVGPIFNRHGEDRRVAYGVNGFYIRIHRAGTVRRFTLYQDIEFERLAPGAHIYTQFGMGRSRLRIPDCLVHVVKTRKGSHLFVRSSWTESDR